MTKPAPVYLNLFHGRDTSTEEMNDWGYNGPSLGPLAYVHCTYGEELKVEFLTAEAMLAFGITPSETRITRGDGVTWTTPDLDFLLHIVEGCVEFQGKYYGDWSVSGPTSKELANA